MSSELDYKGIFKAAAKQFPSLREQTVVHEPGASIEDTVAALKLKANVIFQKRMKNNMSTRPRPDAYEIYLRRAVDNREPMAFWVQPVSFIVPELPELHDKVTRLEDVIGKRIPVKEAQELWPAFLQFAYLYQLGLAIYWNDNAAAPVHTGNFHRETTGRADAFALLATFKEHGQDAIHLAEHLARCCDREPDEYHRSGPLIRTIMERARSLNSLYQAGLAEIYEIGGSICDDNKQFLSRAPKLVH